jgi:ABC-type phosphate transport system substrate-binding protein
MRNLFRRTGLVAVGAIAVSLAITGPAHSDPKFVPDKDDIVGVGSDTTQYLLTDLAGAFNNAKVGGKQRLASFDATGSATIVLRKGADPITRPNGSSAGIDELQVDPNVSFARSSRGPNATGDEGTSFYPYAKDRLSYVYANPKSNVDPSLSASDLFDIYTCAKTDWSDFGMPAGHIEAKVPQAGSGTRTFFLASIGETEAQLEQAINEPDDVCSVNEVEEHDPNAVIGQPNAIAPFSFARYKILPGKIKKKLTYAADKGAPFNVSRNVYNVIRTADTGTLGQYFDTNSWICTSPKAAKIIKKEGFQSLPDGQCGVPLIA